MKPAAPSAFSPAGVLTLILAVGFGLALAWLPSGPSAPAAVTAGGRPDPRIDPRGHERTARQAEIRKRFDEGTALLAAGRYESAASALHRVLELSPRMAEAHVNMGFAMLGMHKFKPAHDFFNGAIELAPMQANAYYGLAAALDRLGQREGAIGAMRTYLHLTQRDDPYRAKAEAALAEWNAQREAGRAAESRGR